ncbi:MAG: acetate uptake transporter [Gammaproteobacteria bacterium]|nr:acetate uptake transporter [Gammaproteobacteria bacterium]MBU6509373.1 acetate uptake transporter [Gammaproteobacteria bacterium]MDE1983584.1 acetate uptake transporter [Gammaproteobacteria bacterium]MDE2107687.1 acetate uptake transporter [Gammaproteobacteria bacterium]MDE2461616.1 acetate uptake transporter [Gammaproteobacteria bacterium]
MANEVTTANEANPAALGLICFGLTTVMLSLVNAGIVPEGGLAVVLPLAFIYGGLMQIVAGVFEAKAGNTFGMTAFVSYGAFWVWFALLIWLGGMKSLDLSHVGSGINVGLILWGFFTLYMWVGTFKLNWALWWIFLTLWVTYFLLGVGGLAGSHSLSLAGGWLGIICGVIAMYTSFAIVTNSTFKRTVLPVGSAPSK